MTVINMYGPTAIRVGANIEEQDEFFCNLAKVTTAHIASDLFATPMTSTPSWVSVMNSKISLGNTLVATGMPMVLL